MSPDVVRFWFDEACGGIEVSSSRLVRHRFRPHTHDTLMLGLIEHGIKEFERERKVYRAPPGSISVVNPGELHTGCRKSADVLHYRALYVPLIVLDLAANSGRLSLDRAVGFCSGVIRDDIVFRALKRAHQAVIDSESRMTCEHLLLDAMRQLVQNHAGLRGRSRESEDHTPVEIRRAREIIDSRYAENVSVLDVSTEVGLSPYHLMRQFCRHVGLPIHAYQIQARVQSAKRLLARGDPVGEVAVQVGFADQSHLTKRFKDIVGSPPGAYQRDIRACR